LQQCFICDTSSLHTEGESDEWGETKTTLVEYLINRRKGTGAVGPGRLEGIKNYYCLIRAKKYNGLIPVTVAWSELLPQIQLHLTSIVIEPTA
jgi:hypothetical protein